MSFVRLAVSRVGAPLRRSVAVQQPQRIVARSFVSSQLRSSDHAEPIIQVRTGCGNKVIVCTLNADYSPHWQQGTGGKDGQVPTDIEQATGLERFELLMKLKGEEAFSLEPLEVTRMGTVQDPVMVFSLVSSLTTSLSHWGGFKQLRSTRTTDW